MNAVEAESVDEVQDIGEVLALSHDHGFICHFGDAYSALELLDCYQSVAMVSPRPCSVNLSGSPKAMSSAEKRDRQRLPNAQRVRLDVVVYRRIYQIFYDSCRQGEQARLTVQLDMSDVIRLDLVSVIVLLLFDQCRGVSESPADSWRRISRLILNDADSCHWKRDKVQIRDEICVV